MTICFEVPFQTFLWFSSNRLSHSKYKFGARAPLNSSWRDEEDGTTLELLFFHLQTMISEWLEVEDDDVVIFNQWCFYTLFFQTDFILDPVFLSFCELVFWTIRSSYFDKSDHIQRAIFKVAFYFSLLNKTWFCVIPRESMICTARQVHWICLLTCFDIIRGSTLFLIFIFFWF